jgi:hypothetical protein
VRERRQRGSRVAGGSGRKLIIALVLLLPGGCAAPAPYFYDTERQILVVGDKRVEDMRLVSKDNALIPPVEFGQLSNSSHNHSTLKDHGAGLSAGDAVQGSPLLVGSGSEARMEMSRVAVHFATGERLMGVNPLTGAEAPVPAQSLLFTRFNGAPHVFLWIPLAAETDGSVQPA